MNGRLLVALCVLAVGAWLLLVETASAHKVHDVRHGQADSLEGMLVGWRVSHALFPTFPTITTLTASIAIEQANWQERRFSRRIGGAPFPEWSAQFFGNDVRGIIAGVRCHLGDEGGTWKPANAYQGFRDNPKSRAILALPFWSWMSVRSAKMHAHSGWLKGRGICQMYYVLWGAPVARSTVSTYEARA